MAVLPRYLTGNGNICVDQYGYQYQCRTGWYNWGRWVLLGILIFGAFFLFFFYSCFNARRRRKAGRQPMYGTGWTTAPFGHGQARYNPNQANQQQARPQETAPPTYQTGGYYGQNQGAYFGGQQTGTELRQPENAWTRPGEPVYQPPQGPPPGKGDGIIR